MKQRNSGPSHLCSHDQHWSYCYDFEGRVEIIKHNKPQNEQAVRLRYFAIVPSLIWQEGSSLASCLLAMERAKAKLDLAYTVDKAYATLDTLDSTRAKWQRARASFMKACLGRGAADHVS